MSTAAKEKKPFLPQRKAPAQPSGGTVAIRGAAAPGRGSAGYVALSIGGEPRVHLLPPEVSARRKDKELKRRVLFVGGVVVALVVLGYGLATVGLASVQSQLAAVQATNISLLAQQSKYGAVTKVNSDIAAIQQSQLTATSQEILWAPYLLTLENTLPAGASINAIQALTDAPLGTPPMRDRTDHEMHASSNFSISFAENFENAASSRGRI